MGRLGSGPRLMGRIVSAVRVSASLCRSMLCISAANAVMWCPSVRLSVCLSIVTFVNSVETSNRILRLFSPSDSDTILVFPYQTLRRYFRRDRPNGGVECRCGRQKSRFSTNIYGYRSMTAAVRTTTATVRRAVCRAYRHTSVNLVYHSQHGRPRRMRREQYRIYLYAALNLKPNRMASTNCARRVVLLKLTTDRHEASMVSKWHNLCDSRATCQIFAIRSCYTPRELPPRDFCLGGNFRVGVFPGVISQNNGAHLS